MWQLIWKLRVPRRIHQFLWLVCHGKILTNKERERKGFTPNLDCHYCAFKTEDLNHIFKYLQESIIYMGEDTATTSCLEWRGLPFKEWLKWNLSYKSYDIYIHWKEIFVVCLQLIWKQRNNVVFNGQETSLHRKIDMILHHSKEAMVAFARKDILYRGSGGKRLVWVGWTKPSQGWFKLNIDGSRT